MTAQGEMSVLVSVEPEGVVAIPNVQEREHIIFNIGNADINQLLPSCH